MANVYDLLNQGNGNNPDLDSSKTIDALMKLELPSGVEVEIKV